MNHLARIQDVLPGPYAVAADAVLTQLLDVVALELETFQEDLDRMRQCHWIRFAYRLADAEKLAALMGITRLPWEGLQQFRERLLPLISARLQGALGPSEIKGFTYEYLLRSEQVLGCVFVPGLQRTPFENAFEPAAERPHMRHLELKENPERLRVSATLQARAGRVPYLHRWRETNKGLTETTISLRIAGLSGGRTSVPVLVNETTGDLIGYAGRIAFGQRLVVESSGGGERLTSATLDGVDVTHRLFSLAGFSLGVPFAKGDLDAQPRLPRLQRGANDFIFLSVGLYDIRGLNRFFFAMAGKDLYEGVFDQTFFEQSLFPSGPVACLDMDWVETEPASFELRVPRCVVVEPFKLVASSTVRTYEQLEDGLRDAIGQLHAAGVRADVRFVPFVEVQQQRVKVTLPWKVLERELGPVGTTEGVDQGGRFGESSLGGSRFE